MLTVEEKSIYEKLYDVMYRNVEQAGAKFAPTKEHFLMMAELEPQRTNMEIFRDVSKEEIVQIAYLAILRRFPDEGAIQYWKQPELVQREDYNKIVIKSVANSIERSMKGIELYNIEAIGIDISRLGRMKEKLLPLLNILYKIYGCLPDPVRKGLKKILRRG